MNIEKKLATLAPNANRKKTKLRACYHASKEPYGAFGNRQENAKIIARAVLGKTQLLPSTFFLNYVFDVSQKKSLFSICTIKFIEKLAERVYSFFGNYQLAFFCQMRRDRQLLNSKESMGNFLD